jgi:hypothetical protein
MLKAMRPVGASRFLANGVEAALPQALLYAVQFGELYPLFCNPHREPHMTIQCIAAGVVGIAAHNRILYQFRVTSYDKASVKGSDGDVCCLLSHFGRVKTPGFSWQLKPVVC